MNKAQQAIVDEITKKIDSEIVGDRTISDETMIDMLEEISSFCEGAVEAKQDELKRARG